MLTMKETKAYIVFDEATKKVLYEGNGVLKAMSLLHTHKGANIQFSTNITAAIFANALAISARQN